MSYSSFICFAPVGIVSAALHALLDILLINETKSHVNKYHRAKELAIGDERKKKVIGK